MALKRYSSVDKPSYKLRVQKTESSAEAPKTADLLTAPKVRQPVLKSMFELRNNSTAITFHIPASR